MYQPGETYDDIREAVGKLCAEFPASYWRALDREMAYPAAFVQALTEAGWLGALIPGNFGGSGLPLSAAAVILEEIHRSGGNAGACHAQMYTMGTLLRHGSEAQKTQYLPKIADGTLRLQAFGVTEPSSGTDTGALRTTAKRDGSQLCHQRAENLDQPSRAFRPHVAFGAHDTARRGNEEDPRSFCFAGRHARSAGQRSHPTADPHHDEPCDHRGLF